MGVAGAALNGAARIIAVASRPNTLELARHYGVTDTVDSTTNAIESINFQLRKLTKSRGHVPDDDAAVKLLYLGIRNITGRHIDGDGLVRERGERGTGTLGWLSRRWARCRHCCRSVSPCRSPNPACGRVGRQRGTKVALF
jgi:hypothetical protein